MARPHGGIEALFLHRCYDCGNYDRVHEKCGVNSAQIYVAEAENPEDGGVG